MIDSTGCISPHGTLFWTSLQLAVRHPIRLGVTVACLVVVLTPFLVGQAILEGVRAEAFESVDSGPDLFVTGYEYGRNASMPEKLVRHAVAHPSVAAARGRIVGRSYLGETLATVVGLEASPGRPVPAKGEAWLGHSVAGLLNLKVGDELAFADQAEIRLIVTRILPIDAGFATSRLIITSLTDAQTLYRTPGRISDLQVWAKSDLNSAQGLLAIAAHLRGSQVPIRVQTRKMVEDYVDRGFTIKGGSFLALYLVAFAVVIPSLLVTTGFGLSVRRQEIGLLKALGFSVLDVMEMTFIETSIVSALAAGLAFLVAWVWLRLLGGALVASLFVAGLEQGGPVVVPATFGPLPLLTGLGFSFLLLTTGAAFTAYRAAIARPMEALR